MTIPAPTAGFAAARDLLSRYPIIDGHNDLPWALRKARSAGPELTDIAQRVEAHRADVCQFRDAQQKFAELDLLGRDQRDLHTAAKPGSQMMRKIAREDVVDHADRAQLFI